MKLKQIKLVNNSEASVIISPLYSPHNDDNLQVLSDEADFESEVFPYYLHFNTAYSRVKKTYLSMLTNDVRKFKKYKSLVRLAEEQNKDLNKHREIFTDLPRLRNDENVVYIERRHPDTIEEAIAHRSNKALSEIAFTTAEIMLSNTLYRDLTAPTVASGHSTLLDELKQSKEQEERYQNKRRYDFIKHDYQHPDKAGKELFEKTDDEFKRELEAECVDYMINLIFVVENNYIKIYDFNARYNDDTVEIVYRLCDLDRIEEDMSKAKRELIAIVQEYANFVKEKYDEKVNVRYLNI